MSDLVILKRLLATNGACVADDKIFQWLESARTTPAERASHAQELARLVRGKPIDVWPTNWTLDQALAAAMWLGLEPEGLAHRLKQVGYRASGTRSCASRATR